MSARHSQSHALARRATDVGWTVTRRVTGAVGWTIHTPHGPYILRCNLNDWRSIINARKDLERRGLLAAEQARDGGRRGRR